MNHRVVQWTTGNVGKQSVAAILAVPHLELVGCYAWSAEKAGRDVGELCGLDPIGVTATGDVDALLALKPDCVVYNPMWHATDELVRILESGANVVTTAAFINGQRLGPERDRLVEACQRGGSSLFGSGISPGFIELLGITTSGLCDRIDCIRVSEEANTTFYDSPETEKPAGFGRTVVELNVRWKKGAAIEPEWEIKDGWVIEVEGRPTVRSTIEFLPPPYFEAETMEDFMALGHIMTAVPAINAIPAVVAAPPGIVTYTDLPLPLPRGFVPA